MGEIITVNNEEFDLQDIETSVLLSEIEDRLTGMSPGDVEFIKDHFDWMDEVDQQRIDAIEEFLENFKIESIQDTQKLEHLGKVFKKYKLEQIETLLPE